MSKASSLLKQYETIALDRFFSSQLTGFLRDIKNEVFPELEYDGVYKNTAESVAVIEVALGGGDEKLKPGPYRKMLADGFKLSAAREFLTDKNCIITRRVLIVRNEKVRKSFLTGWSSGAFSHHDIEVVSAGFTADEEAKIKEILNICAEEQTKVLKNYSEFDTSSDK